VPEKILLVVPLHFLARKAQLVVLVSAFVMVSTVWSVSCLLFFYSRCPPCPAICKSGGTCPRAPMESAPLNTNCKWRSTGGGSTYLGSEWSVPWTSTSSTCIYW